MNNYYCWSNAKFVRWLFDLTFHANALPACRRLLFPLLHAENKGNRRRLHAGKQMPRLNLFHTPEVHVSFFILASRVYLGYFDIQSLLCVAVKFRHGENFFLQIFIGFSWLCGTSFDVMMTMCWMLWRFYLFWSSLLCLWLCWQISVSLCIPLRDVGFLKNVTRGWLTTDIRRY